MGSMPCYLLYYSSQLHRMILLLLLFGLSICVLVMSDSLLIYLS